VARAASSCNVFALPRFLVYEMITMVSMLQILSAMSLPNVIRISLQLGKIARIKKGKRFLDTLYFGTSQYRLSVEGCLRLVYNFTSLLQYTVFKHSSSAQVIKQKGVER